MIRSRLLELEKELGIVPSKKMGQNFLVDEQFAAWIVRQAEIREGENILEVGPGFGALTSLLLAAGARLTAIEFDRKIAAWLRKMFVNSKNFTLIEGDACKVDLDEVFGEGVPFRVVSNLPYSCGSVFLANTLSLKNPPSEMIVMLQKEVAERFSASPGTESYGSFTVRLQVLYETEILKIVPPDVFCPPPDVDSAILRLKRKKDLLPLPVLKVFNDLVKSSFAHRRKKMLKQACAFFPRERVLEAMLLAGVDPDIRAEKVTLDEFRKMAFSLSSGRE
ncbi:MAG: ribosomal RNA small subunit methyltransferase A [Lentisphaeria bacterium]|nr:ribosomal RNA small subunit methyltransferase A [Lentisphaeria bacterium]